MPMVFHEETQQGVDTGLNVDFLPSPMQHAAGRIEFEIEEPVNHAEDYQILRYSPRNPQAGNKFQGRIPVILKALPEWFG